MKRWKYQPARDMGLTPEQRFRSVRRESGLVESVVHIGWWLAVGAYLRLRHRLTIEGRNNLPANPPFIMIANHTSHLDALVLGAALPWRNTDAVLPIAAGDVFFETRTMATLSAGVMNLLPMWRKNCGTHAMLDLRERLIHQPCGFILFPEGARSRDGAMMRFKPGLGMLVAGTSVPVVPCHIRGAFEAWPPDSPKPRSGRIHITIGKAMTFADEPNELVGWRTIASSCQQRIADLAEASATDVGEK